MQRLGRYVRKWNHLDPNSWLYNSYHTVHTLKAGLRSSTTLLSQNSSILWKKNEVRCNSTKMTAVEAAKNTILVTTIPDNLEDSIPDETKRVFDVLREVARKFSKVNKEQNLELEEISLRVAGGWVRDTLRMLPEYHHNISRELPLIVASETVEGMTQPQTPPRPTFDQLGAHPSVLCLETSSSANMQLEFDYAPSNDDEREVCLPNGRKAIATSVVLDPELTKALRIAEALRPREDAYAISENPRTQETSLSQEEDATNRDDVDIALGGVSGAVFAGYILEYAKYMATVRPNSNLPSCKFVNVCADVARSRHLEASRGHIGNVAVDLLRLRAEGYASDANHRTPVSIQPGTPEEDALRRDFTVNALFYNLLTGMIEDYHCGRGLSDLKQGILRPPLNPRAILEDDPLRALRTVRFAAKLNFRLHPGIITAARHPSVRIALLRKVAVERVCAELGKAYRGESSQSDVMFLYPTALIRLMGMADASFPLYPYFLRHVSSVVENPSITHPLNLQSLLLKSGYEQTMCDEVTSKESVATKLNDLNAYVYDPKDNASIEAYAREVLYLNQRNRKRRKGQMHSNVLAALFDESHMLELEKRFPATSILNAADFSNWTRVTEIIEKETKKWVSHQNAKSRTLSSTSNQEMTIKSENMFSKWIESSYALTQVESHTCHLNFLSWYNYGNIMPQTDSPQIKRWDRVMSLTWHIEKWLNWSREILTRESDGERMARWPLFLAMVAWSVSLSAHGTTTSPGAGIPYGSPFPFPNVNYDAARVDKDLSYKISGKLVSRKNETNEDKNSLSALLRTSSHLCPVGPRGSDASIDMMLQNPATAIIPARPIWAWWKQTVIKMSSPPNLDDFQRKLTILYYAFPPILSTSHSDIPIFTNMQQSLAAIAHGKNPQKDLHFLGLSSSSVALRAFVQDGLKESQITSDSAVTILLRSQWLAHTFESNNGQIWRKFFDYCLESNSDLEKILSAEFTDEVQHAKLSAWTRRYFPAPRVAKVAYPMSSGVDYNVDLGWSSDIILPILFFYHTPSDCLRPVAALAHAIIMDKSDIPRSEAQKEPLSLACDWLKQVKDTRGLSNETKLPISGSAVEEHLKQLLEVDKSLKLQAEAKPLVSSICERLSCVQMIAPCANERALEIVLKTWLEDFKMWLEGPC